MDINKTINTNQNYALSLAGRTGQTLPKAQPEKTSFDTARTTDKITVPEGDDARQAYIQKAAQSYRSAFPMSGISFAIFKDVETGEFITRFTNMADGKVTQIPEPELIDFYMRSNGGEAPLVSLES